MSAIENQIGLQSSIAAHFSTVQFHVFVGFFAHFSSFASRFRNSRVVVFFSVSWAFALIFANRKMRNEYGGFSSYWLSKISPCNERTTCLCCVRVCVSDTFPLWVCVRAGVCVCRLSRPRERKFSFDRPIFFFFLVLSSSFSFSHWHGRAVQPIHTPSRAYKYTCKGNRSKHSQCTQRNHFIGIFIHNHIETHLYRLYLERKCMIFTHKCKPKSHRIRKRQFFLIYRKLCFSYPDITAAILYEGDFLYRISFVIRFKVSTLTDAHTYTVHTRVG